MIAGNRRERCRNVVSASLSQLRIMLLQHLAPSAASPIVQSCQSCSPSTVGPDVFRVLGVQTADGLRLHLNWSIKGRQKPCTQVCTSLSRGAGRVNRHRSGKGIVAAAAAASDGRGGPFGLLPYR